nr:MAG TPA: hypothetical protein [Caudoviricetes sp.]
MMNYRYTPKNLYILLFYKYVYSWMTINTLDDPSF